MPTSAAAAARTTERIRRESSILARKRDSIVSFMSTKTKRDSSAVIAECFGTQSRCERGTTILQEEKDTWFQPRMVLKYTALALAVMALPFLIAPLVGITRENGEAGTITKFFGVLIGLTGLLMASCSLQIWTVYAIPTELQLALGAVISMAVFSVVVASLHYIPKGSMYVRIVECAIDKNTAIRNCSVMQTYLDIITVAQSFTLLSSFAAFLDCCLTVSQHKDLEKGKSVDPEKLYTQPDSAYETRQPRRASVAGTKKTRCEPMDESPEMEQASEKTEEQIAAGEGSSTSN